MDKQCVRVQRRRGLARPRHHSGVNVRDADQMVLVTMRKGAGVSEEANTCFGFTIIAAAVVEQR